MFTVERPHAFTRVANDLMIVIGNSPSRVAGVEVSVLVDESLRSASKPVSEADGCHHQAHGHIEMPSAWDDQSVNQLDCGADDSRLT